MPLPIAPPVAPMLARLARDLTGGGWIGRLDGVRFRHPARFARWRPDRDARSCTLDQLRGFG